MWLKIAEKTDTKYIENFLYPSINQAFLFLKKKKKKKKVLSNTFTERETQEKEETTQRQSAKTCDMKIVIHTKKKQEQYAWS